ncbi:hypothetical protein LCGC14_2912730 [marine sediment metagenome]|uniref:Uncharacterized protein n=1 Tax=marine sediment metagenome TaxID=412755 RepID=A0A0F8YCX9_9ZZZZ
MGVYIKKLISVEAFQMTKERSLDNSEWPEWLNRAWRKDITRTGAVFSSPNGYFENDGSMPLFIQEEETGLRKIIWGDFIVRGERGELYISKPDIFRIYWEAIGDE